MTGKDIFGAAVRAIGLWMIVTAVVSLPSILAAPAALIGIALYSIVGAVLLFGADGFVRTAYRETLPNDF
jgi:hypothetical protein